MLAINHFSGEGDWLDVELCTDLAVMNLCLTAFAAVWERAVPHELYHPG